jgi:enhancer of polycomb-like protein
VFRQREKTNRPQTRRRRENDQGSFEKMRQIRKNMEMVYAIVELECRREEKKMHAVQCDIDLQMLQIKLRHEPRTLHEVGGCTS